MTTECSSVLRILVVDDGEDSRLLTCMFLRSLSCKIDIAHTGKQALECLAVNNYELVLMDMQMPVMDGFEATQLIRQKERELGCPRVTILALTGYDRPEERKRILEAGCDGFVPKSFSKDSLLESLAPYLAKK